MEDDAKEERVEKAVSEAKTPDEEEKKEKGDVERKSSDEQAKKAEAAEKKNEAKQETDDETGSAVCKPGLVEKDTPEEEDSPKSQMAREQKEPAKKAPISTFFGEGVNLHICVPAAKKTPTTYVCE